MNPKEREWPGGDSRLDRCLYLVRTGGNYVCLLAEGRVKSLFFRITCASGSSYPIYSARKINNYLVLIMKNLDALEDKKQTERLVTEIRKGSKRLQSLQQCHICFAVSGNIAVIARFACSILLPCCSLSNGSCRNPCPTMPSIQLPLLLLCLTSCGVCFNGGHLLPEESENMGKNPLNDILQRCESLILQSALKKAEKEEQINKGISLTGDTHLVMGQNLAEIIRSKVWLL